MDGRKYPAYAHFYAAYFHPDWRLDDPLPDDVVRQFVRAEPHSKQDALSIELCGLLDSGCTEVELEAALAPWNTFRPQDVELTVREWIERLLVILNQKNGS
jgi:hypothetical protein